MKGLLLILLSLFFLVTGADAQSVIPKDDTLKAGTIKVRKQPVRPFYQVSYVQRQATVRGGDTNYVIQISSRAQIQAPAKEWNFGDQLARIVEYGYAVRDTPKTDTIYLEVFINTNGKITRVYNDSPDNAATIPAPLLEQTFYGIQKCSEHDWEPGGYRFTKRFKRKGELHRSPFLCKLTIVVSSRPITEEQKKTGVRYSTDIDLTNGETELSTNREGRRN